MAGYIKQVGYISMTLDRYLVPVVDSIAGSEPEARRDDMTSKTGNLSTGLSKCS